MSLPAEFGSPVRTCGGPLRPVDHAQYKSIVTKRIWATLGRGTGPVWQGRYHDRVVRTDREAAAIRRYIADNPARWDPDADRADGHRA